VVDSTLPPDFATVGPLPEAGWERRSERRWSHGPVSGWKHLGLSAEDRNADGQIDRLVSGYDPYPSYNFRTWTDSDHDGRFDMFEDFINGKADVDIPVPQIR
jgi:hypothetical protein